MNAVAFFFAAYIPYEQGEKYAHGEHVQVPLWAAVGGRVVFGIALGRYESKRKTFSKKREMKPATANNRAGVDAGCPVLFAFERAWSRTAQRARWVWISRRN